MIAVQSRAFLKTMKANSEFTSSKESHPNLCPRPATFYQII